MTDPTSVGSRLGESLLPMQFGGQFLELAVAFFVLAIVAWILGARGIAGLTMEIARIMVLVFLVLAVLTFVL